MFPLFMLTGTCLSLGHYKYFSHSADKQTSRKVANSLSEEYSFDLRKLQNNSIDDDKITWQEIVHRNKEITKKEIKYYHKACKSKIPLIGPIFSTRCKFFEEASKEVDQLGANLGPGEFYQRLQNTRKEYLVDALQYDFIRAEDISELSLSEYFIFDEESKILIKPIINSRVNIFFFKFKDDSSHSSIDASYINNRYSPSLLKTRPRYKRKNIKNSDKQLYHSRKKMIKLSHRNNVSLQFHKSTVDFMSYSGIQSKNWSTNSNLEYLKRFNPLDRTYFFIAYFEGQAFFRFFALNDIEMKNSDNANNEKTMLILDDSIEDKAALEWLKLRSKIKSYRLEYQIIR